MLIVVFGYLSTSIIQTQSFGSKIDLLKYLHIQGEIHLYAIERSLLEDQSEATIETLKERDPRFLIEIEKVDQNETNTTLQYHVTIEAKDEHVRLFRSIAIEKNL